MSPIIFLRDMWLVLTKSGLKKHVRYFQNSGPAGENQGAGVSFLPNRLIKLLSLPWPEPWG
ncbi:hypothetical protein ES708_22717 [subsurface metagenome]